MIRYETRKIESRHKLHEGVNYDNQQECLQGVGFDYFFQESEHTHKPVFLVNIETNQIRLSDDKKIFTLRSKSEFELAGDLKDFERTGFDFFERLLIQGYSHMQGIFSITMQAHELNFPIPPEQDFKTIEEELMNEKSLFMNRFFQT